MVAGRSRLLEPREAVPQVLKQRDSLQEHPELSRDRPRLRAKAIGIGNDMPLAPKQRLPGSKPRGLPACVVKAVWLSMIAAVGVGLWPNFFGACRNKLRTTRYHLSLSWRLRIFANPKKSQTRQNSSPFCFGLTLRLLEPALDISADFCLVGAQLNAVTAEPGTPYGVCPGGPISVNINQA